MSKPYPWAKTMMLRRKDAEEVYEIEDRLTKLLDELSEALEPYVVGDKYTHRVPYMLLCILDRYDREASIAAAFGFLQRTREDDKERAMKRESLKRLRLPQEPKP